MVPADIAQSLGRACKQQKVTVGITDDEIAGALRFALRRT
jgi:hypothetical protein